MWVLKPEFQLNIFTVKGEKNPEWRHILLCGSHNFKTKEKNVWDYNWSFKRHLDVCGLTHFARWSFLISHHLTQYSLTFLTDTLLILILYECAQKISSVFISTEQRFKIRKKLLREWFMYCCNVTIFRICT